MLYWIRGFLFTAIIVLLTTGCSTKFKNTKKSYNARTKSHSVLKSRSNNNHALVTSYKTPKSSLKHPTMRPYKVLGENYYPHAAKKGDIFKGVSSWYGPDFNGKLTSNGETYDMYSFTCAHKTLPMQTILRVTNLDNGKEVVVRVNDRGPFVKQRIIDLSKAAAYAIEMTKKGTANVRLEVLGFYDKHSSKVKPITPTKNIKKGYKKRYTHYFVQIGSFGRFEGAKAYQERFERIGYNHEVIIKDFFINGSRVYKVLLSGFNSEQKARDFIANNEGFENAFIVKK